MQTRLAKRWGFLWGARSGDALRSAIWESPTCRSLLSVLWNNYVLFAVIPPDGPVRRILKYSYGEDFDLRMQAAGSEIVLAPWMIWQGIWRPRSKPFHNSVPGSMASGEFHAEVVIPEDLRVERAVLYDFAQERHE